MKVAKKALLASAVLALSTGAYAMEAMDDQSLSDATGQQGLTITTALKVSGATMVYTDSDGLTTSGTYNKSGDLVVQGIGISDGSGNGAGIVTTIDVGGDNVVTAASKALLNIGITGTTNLVMAFNTISVISTGVDGTNNPNLGGTTVGVLSNVINTTGAQTLTVASGYSIQVQLGSGASNFAALSGNLGTITLGSVAVTTGAYSGANNAIFLKDSSGGVSGGQLGIAGLQVSGLNLGTVAAPTLVDVCNGVAVGVCTAADTTGIDIVISTVGLTSVALTMANITAGSASTASLGSVYLSGLNLSGTKINIAGH